MNSRRILSVLMISITSSLSMGCADDTAQDVNPCDGGGVLVELNDQTVCAYQQAIVIETGFVCPASHPNRQDTGNFTVCAQKRGGLKGPEIDVVRDVIERTGKWQLEPRTVVPVVRPPQDDPLDPEQLDILWVLDNSFSMCEENAVLRANLDKVLDPLVQKDFHIGITTTHAPEGAGSIEPVAREALLQSTPQPVPGNNQGCLRGQGNGSEFSPLRRAIDDARACLADPSIASSFEWTDAQIDCALQSSRLQDQSNCVTSSALPDVTGDGEHDIFDLFPASTQYRSLPLVFRRADYMSGAQVDRARLLADLRCAMTVGTRGDGYEKGLRAAVKAVGPELTGGAFMAAGADLTAPNHGLIRKDARFALVIISDENDCSHDSSIMELGNFCGANICEYMNSAQVPEDQSALISPEKFADELLMSLSTVKGATVDPANAFIATLTGTSTRYNQPFPNCDQSKPEIPAACSSALGEAYSGDRYERFAQQFPNHFPNTVRSGEYEPLGYMCTDDFGPALGELGAVIVR